MSQPTATSDRTAALERAVGLVRIAFAVLAAVALGVQAEHVAAEHAPMSNFFSYFTNLGNMAAVLVLLTGGVLGLRGRPGVPSGLRGAVALYLTLTGVIYAVLLSGYQLPLAIAWVNIVVHKVMPVVVLADWLLVPPARWIERRTAVAWLAFPLLFLAYSLIRGPIVDWYPYPFLDPRHPGGYGRVAVACAMITGLFLAVAAALAWAGNRAHGRRVVVDEPVTLAPADPPQR